MVLPDSSRSGQIQNDCLTTSPAGEDKPGAVFALPRLARRSALAKTGAPRPLADGNPAPVITLSIRSPFDAPAKRGLAQGTLPKAAKVE